MTVNGVRCTDFKELVRREAAGWTPGRLRSKVTRTVGERPVRGLFGRLVVVMLAVALSGSACGPLQSASTIGDAEEAIDAAQEAEATQYAIYEYWMAILYLEKAKRVEGRAEYAAAESFAAEAARFAAEAVEVAGKQKMRDQVMQQRHKRRRKADK